MSKSELEIAAICKKHGVDKSAFDKVFEEIYELPKVSINEEGDSYVIDCFGQGYGVGFSDGEMVFWPCGG